MKRNRILLLIAAATTAWGVDVSARNTNDNPLPPANARATLSADYKMVTVTWDAVGTQGEDGGVVDPAEVTYYIFDAFGSLFDPAIAVTAETSYTFDYSDLEGQDFVAYQVTAGVDEVWYSLPATTNIVPVGAPYTLPWCESFAGRKQQYAWLIDPDSSSQATSKLCSDTQQPGSTDGDGGYLMITPKKKGDVFGIISAKIDINDAQNPELKFDYLCAANRLVVKSSADGGEMMDLATIEMGQEPATEWTTATVSLAGMEATDYIQVELWYEAYASTASLLLDRIGVAESEESGVAPAMAAMKGAQIRVDGRVVTVESADVTDMSVTRVDGSMIKSAKGTSMTVDATPGIYIVKAGDTVKKIAVK